jgi:ParB family transcriptional regulator, chromosome partitioning protein
VASPAPRARGFGLGRGLDSLIPRTDAERGVVELPLDRIGRNPQQPREIFDDTTLGELAASMAVHGVIQPVVVRELADGDYELIAGERRLRAARLAGLTTIPAIVRETDQERSLEMALIENLQREDLNPVEAARAYQQLIERFGLTHEAVARQVGKSRVAVTNALRLLDLAPETLRAIAEGRITEGHGRALAAISLNELQRAVLQVVVDRRLSVRETEELVRRKRNEAVRAPVQGGLSADLRDLEAQLRGMLATKVGIVRTRRGGRLVIDFYSDEELDRLYSVISRGIGAAHERQAGAGSSVAADDALQGQA